MPGVGSPKIPVSSTAEMSNNTTITSQVVTLYPQIKHEIVLQYLR